MSISEYFIVADVQSASLRIIIDKVALESYTKTADSEKGFEYAPPLKRYTLMIWMSDADSTAIF